VCGCASCRPAIAGVDIVCSDSPPRIDSYFKVYVPLDQMSKFHLENLDECVKVISSMRLLLGAEQCEGGAIQSAADLIRLLFHLLFLFFLFLGLQLKCNGDVVPGKYEVRVNATHLRFTFLPDRALNPMKPGPCSDQPACTLATSREGQRRHCPAPCSAAHPSPSLL